MISRNTQFTHLSLLLCCLSIVASILLGFMQDKQNPIHTYVESQHEPNQDDTISQIPSKVQIQWNDGRYTITIDEKPFWINGGAGYYNLELLKEMGGNTFRTWDTFHIDEYLEIADSLGLYVILGIDIGKERHGFDYDDPISVAKQKEQIEQLVLKHHSHSSILAWVIGNEAEIFYTNLKLWDAINDISKMIHEIDTFHLTSTACLPNQPSIEHVMTKCDDLDFITFNTFGNKIPEITQQMNHTYKVPYLVGEWSDLGYWSAEETEWGSPVEPSIVNKYFSRKHYYQKVMTHANGYCLGSCIFFWGNKQERTHTWFSLFMDQGEKTALVDLMSYLWKGEGPDNHAPFLTDIKLNNERKDSVNIYLYRESKYTASVEGWDPENEELVYHWEILPEGNYSSITGGDPEDRLQPVGNLGYPVSTPFITFRTPDKPGAYRLFVYAHDPSCNGAYANIPFFVVEKAYN